MSCFELSFATINLSSGESESEPTLGMTGGDTGWNDQCSFRCCCISSAMDSLEIDELESGHGNPAVTQEVRSAICSSESRWLGGMS